MAATGAPLLAATFHKVSLVAPLANAVALGPGLLALPLASLLVVLDAALPAITLPLFWLGDGLAGLVLAAIGFLGILKARLIQSAVSRQREFLADASAVEFTRNPDGLVSALRKIGAGGSQLQSAHASEVGHLLIAEGKRSFFSRLFATHPPIEERIRRLQGR